MSKLSLEELRKLREKNKDTMEKRDSSDKDIQILIGMGTCGIAAGARDTLQAFVEEIEKLGLKNVIIKPTGCMGSCSVEPTVEVMVPGMPAVLYGKITADMAKKVVDKHIVNKQLLNDLIYDKPSADILK